MNKKVYLVVTLVLVATFALTMSAVAENKSFKQASRDTAKASVNYPANLVNESVNTVGKAVKGTADTVVNTGKAVGKTVTGDVNAAPEIVTEPVKGAAVTIKNATVDTVETPIIAGKKTAEQNR